MKTLALNMIVGPGEAGELERCLTAFNAANVFDEIVIVTTTGDPSVYETAKKHIDWIYSYKWSTQRYPFGNFAGARNEALKHTTSDYVMWLDADDMPCENFELIINRLREAIVDKRDDDVYMMDYVITDTVKTRRERIFKRRSDLFWQFPVHEQLTIQSGIKMVYLENVSIVHAPVKAQQVSIGRNLAILQHEADKCGTPQIMFYYAKELSNNCNQQKATRIMQHVLDKREGTEDMMAQAALFLANLQLSFGDTAKAETYFRIVLSYSNAYAEAYVRLGDIAADKGDMQRASKFYSKARAVSFDGGGLCDTAFQCLIPSRKLMWLAYNAGNKELAVLYSRDVLQYSPTDEGANKVRIEFAEEVLNGQRKNQNT
jgi:hypothetical protein